MLKYIFGAIFIALVWAAAIVFHGVTALFWAAIVVTAVVVLGLAAWAIVKAIATRRAASAIEAGLGDVSGKSSIRPDQQAEITAMQVEFQKAIGGLKSSRLGHKGRDALSILPWYVIIGPPGAGKTTALRSSGLQFPYAKGGKVKGVGGTRNCDWWLTNEAIILDTAGRWSTQDDDHEEWLAFLDLLRKTRPKKPINGILLAVSLLDLEGGEEEMSDLAKKLRDRLDEVTGRLDMVVPVYFLVTKTDLVPGFVEMFGDLRDKERGRIWGVSLPLLASPDERADMLAEQLQELFDITGARSFGRMCEERRVDARFKIFEFSRQLEAVGQNLTALVTELFAENVYQDAPILRGVYFTSGTQEGRPIDRIMQSMASAFGVAGRAAAAVAVTKPKSYFLRDVFTRVVFPDQAAAVRSTRVMRKERLRRILLTAGAFALAAGFLFLPIRSYLANAGYARDARRTVEKLASSKTSRDGAGLVSAESLESVEDISKRLAEGASSSALFPRASVTKQLHTAVERLVVRPILRADLGRAAAGGLGASELMDALVLHLLLTQDKQPDEPTPRTDRWESAVGLAAEKAASRWVSLTNEPAAGRAPRVLENLVKFYAGAIADPADMIDRDKKFVTYARSTLIGSGDDPLAEIVNDPAMPRDLKSIDLLGSAVVLFGPQQEKNKKEVAVRGAFTPAGYQAVKKRLAQLEKAQDDDENSWILGKERKARDARAIAKIQADYYVQYVAAWKRFLLSLAMREPASLDEARTLLKRLTAEKPFEVAWKNISENLVIDDESLGDKALGVLRGVAEKKAAQKARGVKIPKGEEEEDNRDPGVRQIETAFEGLMRFGSVKPTGFEQYNQILTEVSGAMGEEGMPDAKAFQTAIKNARTNLSNLIARYDDQGWEQGMLEKILMPPLRGAEVAVVGASADSANRKWCETVYVAFDQLLAGKYPFAGGRPSGYAKIADIEKFFQPATGTLWQYFGDSLGSDIDRVGTTFRMKDGAAVRYRDEFLKFLTRAAEITARLFAKEPTKVAMQVGVHIRPSAQYSKIILDLGIKKITGLNAVDRWDEFTWPVRRANLRLFVKTEEIEAIGPRDESEWALFHLLAQGTNATKNGDFVSLTYPAANGQTRIQVDFRPENIREIFSKFVLPRSITAGGGSCRK
ncbi:MAG: type VI secretion system membrane subunit TssM [Deltaproteobacteria bacterium]|nr:type VI secretion system membrane subunit TssM [Deltaproteobacteria bacterium]